ncbi:unnamed protein product [Owenia fusiformis]|uniref:Uncharacterized protein n=1 Tax=Owenia fusiformis TaxID=6347 RepID=A0A8J1TFX7_OWEFU|nr:unnamed protein product [Owenia fusiformis]
MSATLVLTESSMSSISPQQRLKSPRVQSPRLESPQLSTSSSPNHLFGHSLQINRESPQSRSNSPHDSRNSPHQRISPKTFGNSPHGSENSPQLRGISPQVTEDIPQARGKSPLAQESSLPGLGKTTEIIVYDKCTSGLGIKIIGGVSNSDDRKDFGIFVKRILIGGLAAKDSRLQEGDLIVEVNKETLIDVTNERAVSILRNASSSGRVTMVIVRDQDSREEFLELMEMQNGYSYSTASSDCRSVTSCASTPSILPQEKRSWGLQGDHLSPVNVGSRSLTPLSNGYHANVPSHDQDSDLLSESDQESTTPTSYSPPPGGNFNNYSLPTPKIANNIAMLHQQHLQSTQPRGHHYSMTSQVLNSSTPQYNTAFIPTMRSMMPPGASNPKVMSNSRSNQQDISPIEAPTGGEMRGSPLGCNMVSPQLPYSYNTPSPQMNNSRKLSLDPHVRLKIEKLEEALKYLGLEPTVDQQLQLRQSLMADAAGTVSYGQFVQAAREIFKVELEQRSIGSSALYFSANDITSFTEPPAFKPQQSTLHEHSPPSPVEYSPVSNANEDLETVVRERDSLRREVDRLKILLKDKDRACNTAEEELLRIRKDAQGAIHESRALRSKVHLADQAQRAARNMEQDYEEVVKLLENEIAELKAQMGKEMDSPAVQKRLAVLGCQLRKAELGKKTYEVATEKLLHFAEMVHETLSTQGDVAFIRKTPVEEGETARVDGKPPGYLGKHKKHSPRSLCAESRDVVKAVKSLIEVEPLPFGWEETYTEDGIKYYTNHLTQVTTWTHPASNVLKKPTPVTHIQHSSEYVAPSAKNIPGTQT